MKVANTKIKAVTGDQTMFNDKIWNIVGDKMQGPKTIYTLKRSDETITYTYTMKEKNHLYKVQNSGQHKV